MTLTGSIISTRELLSRLKINRRRFDYLRELHNRTFPAPIKMIGTSNMWDLGSVGTIATLDNSIRKYAIKAKVL